MRVLGSKRIVAVAALMLFGCVGGQINLGTRMFDHFGRVGQIQTALITGDLDGARRPAEWLARYERFDGLPEGSEGWVTEIREAAREIATSDDIPEATAATGRLAGLCARCHRETDGGPTFEIATSRPEGDRIGDHMGRHLWAMDRMWEGLIGPSTIVWATGTDAIADARPEDEFDEGIELELARRVHDLANQARSTTERDRPDIYAQLLDTCAECHTRLGVGGR